MNAQLAQPPLDVTSLFESIPEPPAPIDQSPETEWHPTPSQREALGKLHIAADVFARVGDRKLAGFSPACRRHLLLGPSGAGKSALALQFAQQRDSRFVTLDGGGWTVAGSARANPTLKQVRDFVRSAPAPESGGLEGIVFVDELCKLLPRSEDLAGSGWSLSCWAECIALLESDERLLSHEWSQDDVRRFRRHWMILAGAAFQLALDEVRKASCRGDIGFGPSDGTKPTHVEKVSEYLPEEILSRFAEPIYLEPPTRRDFAAAIGRIHGELGVSLKRPIEVLLDEAVAAKGGMRFVELYLARIIYENPHAVRPIAKAKEQTSQKVEFDILGPDYYSQAKTASELSARLRTHLCCIFAKLCSLSYSGSERPKSVTAFVDDPKLGECIRGAMRACDLCQTIGPGFALSVDQLVEWRGVAWGAIQEHCGALDHLGLTSIWVEAWSLSETVLHYYYRFQQAARQGCLR